jgi:nucleotide-binding universal stress UspA family protein
MKRRLDGRDAGSARADAEGRTTAVRHIKRERKRHVLLALTDRDHPTATLQQCSALARILEAELHVLQVLPPENDLFPVVPGLDLVQATRRVERCLAAARAAKIWCDDVLPEPLPPKRLRIRIGRFVEDAASRAAEVDAALIVLAPSTGWLGITATALAHASSIPVLVARGPLSENTLLAATDLEDESFWVLRKAVELGARLGAPVVALHNVSCLAVGFSHKLPSCAASAGGGPAESRGLRLVRATERLGAAMGTILATELDPVDAILDQARAHDARLIVVGTRPDYEGDRFIARSVAAEVVNRSDRSVLVTPLTPASGACPHTG